MKYKLKRDLPFAKAGTKIEYRLKKDEHYAIFLYSTDGDDPSTYWIGLECDNRDLAKMISEGWIEEIQPREFWIAEYHNYQGKVFYSEQNAQNSSNNLKEVIKVREVLE